jgi:hypothetical protein
MNPFSELKKTIKDMGCVFEARQDKIIIFDGDNTKPAIHHWRMITSLFWNTLYVEIIGVEDARWTLPIADYLKKVALRKEMAITIISGASIALRKRMLRYNNFKNIERAIEDNDWFGMLDGFDPEVTIIKTHDEQEKTQLVDFYQGITSTLQKLKIKYPTFLYYSYAAFKYKYSVIGYYFEGSRENMEFQCDGNLYTIKTLNENIVSATMEETFIKIEHYFNNLHAMNRLTNLYSPPRFHYDRYMDRLGTLSTAEIEIIYEQLLLRYQACEIEERLVEGCILPCVKISSAFKYLEILDFFFVFDAVEQISTCQVFSSQESVFEYLSGLINTKELEK